LNSNSPLDKELYLKGYIEVPNACRDQDGQGECVAPAQGGTTLYRNAYTQAGAQENNMMFRGKSPTIPNPSLHENSPAPPYSPASSRQMPVRR